MSDATPTEDENRSPSLGGRVEAMCDRFEAAWRAGQRPAIEDYLGAVSESARTALFRELLVLELTYREQAGDCPTPDDYSGRFPEHAERIEAVFSNQIVTRREGSGASPDSTPTRPAGDADSAGPRYQIRESHARGGLGEVFKAHDRELRRVVALKRMQAGHADSPESRARFVREAEITGRLEHPGIVPVYGLCHDPDGRPYYAMRFIEGKTFKEAIQRFHEAENPGRDPGARILALRKLLRHFLDACDAVGFAHSRGVLHRDLKPSNIMLGPYGETLVVDWGLAKPIDQSDDAPDRLEAGPGWCLSESDLTLTETGAALGTPQYSSPEQAEGRWDEVGPASDLYSLGATLYTLLSGHSPFARQSDAVVPPEIERGAIPPLRTALPGVSRLRALEAICRKAMAPKPEDRYASARALAEDFEHWLADEPVAADHEGWHQRLARWARRHQSWMVAGTMTLLMVTVVSVAAMLFLRNAWLDASMANTREETQRERANTQRDLAQKERDLARMRAAHSALDLARNLFEKEKFDEGMLWLGHALRDVRDVPSGADDLRHVIWANLGSGQARLHPARERFDLPGRVWAAAFSPDGKTILTGSDDNMARLWNADTGQPIGPPLAHQGVVRAVAFRPDGKVIVTGIVTSEGVRLWNVATGQPIGLPFEDRKGATAVAFSPDGKKLLVGSYSQTARLWDADTGRPIGPPLRHQGAVYAVGFSPDGKTLLTGCYDKTARLWNADTGQPIGPPLTHQDPVLGAAFRPDGKTVATASWDKTVRFWDTATGQPVGPTLRHPDRVHAVAYRPDGKVVATGGYDGTVQLWDADTGQPIGPQLKHHGEVFAVAFRPDGKALVTSGDRGAWLWDVATDLPIRPYLEHKGPVNAVAFRPDGKAIATASADETARLWDADTGRPMGPPLGHEGAVLAVAFRPDGAAVATGSADDTAQLWDAHTGLPIGEPLMHGYPFRAVAFHPDGKVVATGTGAGNLWDAATGRPRYPWLLHGAAVFVIAFRPGSSTILTGGADNTARLWDADTGLPIGEPLTHGGPVYVAAFRPGGAAVVTGGADNTARLWDATTGRAIGPPLVHRAAVRAVAFRSDGKALVTGTADGVAQQWDADTGLPIGPPLRHRTAVRAVAFGQDGRRSSRAARTRRRGSGTPTPACRSGHR
jgi:WD40 repeat protein/serine/threonine protein kinase